METRAPFVMIGAFVLAAIIAVFGFVYWLHNTGGPGSVPTFPRRIKWKSRARTSATSRAT